MGIAIKPRQNSHKLPVNEHQLALRVMAVDEMGIAWKETADMAYASSWGVSKVRRTPWGSTARLYHTDK
jgi:hypothetical protein